MTPIKYKLNFVEMKSVAFVTDFAKDLLPIDRSIVWKTVKETKKSKF